MSDGRTTRVGETRRLRAAAAVLLLPLTLAGCLSDKPDPTKPDPLTGLPKRIPAGEREVAATYTPGGRPSTPATLAAATPRSSDGSLSIPNGRTSDADHSLQATGAWSGTESRSAPPAVATSGGSVTGARLGAPPTGRGNDASSNPMAAGAGLRVRTFEEAQQFLMARGVKWQDLQTTGEGEWKYSCTLPNKASSSSMKTYEASDRYGLVAMQKVIDQIVRDQGR